MYSNWEYLPNSRHIKRILTSLRSETESWITVGRQECYDNPPNRDRSRYSALQKLSLTGRGLHRQYCLEEAQYAAKRARPDYMDHHWYDMYWPLVKNPVSDAMLALVAFDDSAKYMSYTTEEIQIWSRLNEDPAAQLLAPAVEALNYMEYRYGPLSFDASAWEV